MANIVQYGDISPRTAAYVVKDLLKRAIPYMVIEKFGQQYPIPLNSTRNAKFRRYFLTGATGSAGDGNAANAFFTPLSLTPLLEGVTPAGLKLAFQDYVVQLNQYGDFIQITDVVEDTHEDPVLQEATQILSESAAQTMEAIRYNILKAGTNVFYANGGARASVNTPITLALQRQITTALNRQNAKFITQVVARRRTSARSPWKPHTSRSSTRTARPTSAAWPGSSRPSSTARSRRTRTRSAQWSACATSRPPCSARLLMRAARRV
jgi:N4-gp56 family major capsid protein